MHAPPLMHAVPLTDWPPFANAIRVLLVGGGAAVMVQALHAWARVGESAVPFQQHGCMHARMQMHRSRCQLRITAWGARVCCWQPYSQVCGLIRDSSPLPQILDLHWPGLARRPRLADVPNWLRQGCNRSGAACSSTAEHLPDIDSRIRSQCIPCKLTFHPCT